MDAILASAAKYSAGLAIRSGISIAGGFAIRQVSAYISKVPRNFNKDELELISRRLDQKIKIVTPAIDLIEIIASRGNTTLNSTVQLTVSLRNDINAFGKRMLEVIEDDGAAPTGSKESTKRIIEDMKALLARIEDAVPLISLALTTSGANLSASLPNTVSPSRLLQASSFLQNADSRFVVASDGETQVGPSFSLKLYTIFEGHSRQTQDPNISNITWQETYARAIVEVVRMPIHHDLGHTSYDRDNHKIEYLYHFRVTENLDDGRYHEELESGRIRRDAQGFIRGASRDIPVHNIARLFFSASGRLLNIEEARTPVLVLKINHGLRGPSALIRAMFGDGGENHEAGNSDSGDKEPPSEEQEGYVPADDLEWVALELWADDDESDNSDGDQFDTASEHSSSETDDGPAVEHHGPNSELNVKNLTSEADMDELAMQMQVLEMSKTPTVSSTTGSSKNELATLSLLEYILRLSALQTSEQQSVLSISDERISLFLRDDNAQSRSRSHQEVEAVRRKSNDRFDTPASSVLYEEFIPGTVVRPRKGARRSRQATPTSTIDTPRTHIKTRHRRPTTLDTPPPPPSSSQGKDPSTTGRWPHHLEQEEREATAGESPLAVSKNPFRAAVDAGGDLIDNGFSSRLRHSVASDSPPGPSSSPAAPDGVSDSETVAPGETSASQSPQIVFLANRL